MKKLQNLGRILSKEEQKKLIGGVLGGQACGTICWNCAVLSVRCSTTGICVSTPLGVSCPDGSWHDCPTSGNYCS